MAADPAAIAAASMRKEWSGALRSIPRFHADRVKGNNWRHHRQDLETWAVLHQINLVATVEQQKLAVCSSLKGNAHRAVQLHGPGKPSFINAASIDAYLDVIQAVFQPEAETQLARQDFLAREQGIQEPVSEYLAEKYALYFASVPVAADRSFRDLKEQCLKGLKSRFVQSEVITKNPQNEDDLLQVCATAVGQAREGHALNTGFFGANLDGLASTTMPNRYLMDQSEPMEIGRVGEDRDCYQCGKKGHLSRNCPSKTPAGGGRGGQGSRGGRGGANRGEQDRLVCYYCGKKGHRRPECRALKADKQAGNVHADKIAKKAPSGAKRIDDGEPTVEEDPESGAEGDSEDDFGSVGAIYDPEDLDAPGFWNLADLRSFRKGPPRK